jgi:Leucine rich repeat variant
MVALRQARDPATAPDRLERLARHRDRLVRAAVVANPNTSLAALGRLGAAFPDELASNPLLGWLHVENADFLALFPALVRHRLLMVGKVGLLWWAARFGTEDDKRALLMNPNVPVELLMWLAEHGSEVVQVLARDHIRFPGPIEPSIATRPLPTATSGDFEELVSMGLIPSWMLASAVHATDVDVRRMVAARAELTAADVDVLLFDADERVRTIASQHANVSAQTLAFLAVLDDVSAPLLPFPALVFDRLLATPDGLVRLSHRADLPDDIAQAMATSQSWTVRRAIAASPSFTAELSMSLALDLDRDVRAAVAANPHALALVVALLRSDDDSLVREACPRGPAAEVNRVRLDQLEQRGERGMVLAAAQANAGRARLGRFAGDANWRVRQACARNPATPTSLLARLAADADRDVRMAVGRNPSTSINVGKRLAVDLDDGVRLSVVATAADTATLRLFAHETDSAVRAAAVGNPALPDDLVLSLVRQGDTIVRRAAAGRASLSVDTFVELVETDDDDVRLALLRRPDLPAGALARLLAPELAADARVLVNTPERLAPERVVALVAAVPWVVPAITDRDDLAGVVQALGASTEWRSRQRAADRAGADHVDLLVRLSTDHDHDVRQAVARNMATPAHIVERLSADDSAPVRRAALERPDLGADTVSRLLHDDDADVRAAALCHPSCPAHLADEQRALDGGGRLPSSVLRAAAGGAMQRRLAVARHPRATAKLLTALAKDDYWQVREAVAANPNAPVTVLTRLANDSDRDVRRAVAAHARTPRSVLDGLVVDGSDIVRKQAIMHPNLDSEGRQLMLAALARRSSRSSSEATRTAAAASPFLPIADLRQRRQWQSLDWWVRYGVAVNQRTPRAVLERLADDGHVAVRAAARTQLMQGRL